LPSVDAKESLQPPGKKEQSDGEQAAAARAIVCEIVASNLSSSLTDRTRTDNNWVKKGSHVMIVGADAKALLQTYPRNPKPDPHKPYVPRIGRVLIALGRDAADVPIMHTFGPNALVSFKVWTDEVI